MIDIQDKNYCPSLEEIGEYVNNPGLKEKETVEVILQECTAELRDIYNQTKTGNGQKWLTIDLEDKDKMYADIFRLIDIRRR